MLQFQDTTKHDIKGTPRIIRQDTGEILWQGENVIVNTVKSLFARLFANNLPNTPLTAGANLLSDDCLYAVWGLALGTGDPTWSPDTQPVETPSQTALISQVLRKQLSAANYVITPDQVNFTPVPYFTNLVDFQTLVNSTTDNIPGVGIREMGLIGGGTKNTAVPGVVPTLMLTAPFWNPADVSFNGGPTPNSVTLINYKTLPPLILPPNVTLIFSWILSF
jgi:hypothetical protein